MYVREYDDLKDNGGGGGGILQNLAPLWSLSSLLGMGHVVPAFCRCSHQGPLLRAKAKTSVLHASCSSGCQGRAEVSHQGRGRLRVHEQSGARCLQSQVDNVAPGTRWQDLKEPQNRRPQDIQDSMVNEPERDVAHRCASAVIVAERKLKN